MSLTRTHTLRLRPFVVRVIRSRTPKSLPDGYGRLRSATVAQEHILHESSAGGLTLVGSVQASQSRSRLVKATTKPSNIAHACEHLRTIPNSPEQYCSFGTRGGPIARKRPAQARKALAAWTARSSY